MNVHQKIKQIALDESGSDVQFGQRIGDIYAMCRCYYQCWPASRWIIQRARDKENIVKDFGSAGLDAHREFWMMMDEIPSSCGLTIEECLEAGKTTFGPNA